MRFGETDSAGVMHFHQLLRWGHESWEESLERFKIKPSEIFPSCRPEVQINLETSLPIVHCSADFILPIYAGDQLTVLIKPQRIDLNSFEVSTIFLLADKSVARALIRHVAIHRRSRNRCPLPPAIERWLEASLIQIQ